MVRPSPILPASRSFATDANAGVWNLLDFHGAPFELTIRIVAIVGQQGVESVAQELRHLRLGPRAALERDPADALRLRIVIRSGPHDASPSRQPWTPQSRIRVSRSFGAAATTASRSSRVQGGSPVAWRKPGDVRRRPARPATARFTMLGDTSVTPGIAGVTRSSGSSTRGLRISLSLRHAAGSVTRSRVPRRGS
jgi:hypothetical protein